MQKNEPFIASVAMQLSYAERDSNSNQRKNCEKTNKQKHWLHDGTPEFHKVILF